MGMALKKPSDFMKGRFCDFCFNAWAFSMAQYTLCKAPFPFAHAFKPYLANSLGLFSSEDFFKNMQMRSM